ncbi:MAG: map, partial [Microbacteriaceae bacterium]|nr:map [Microbacteriaceae bacterium]
QSIARPEYVGKKAPANYTGGDVYPAASVDLIRESSVIAAQAIQAVGRYIEDVTSGAYPAPEHEYE